MTKHDLEILLGQLRSMGLIVESVDEPLGRITVRIPEVDRER